jgi:cytochrome P450
MCDWSTYLGYDIMGDLTFGKRFNCMESEEHRYIPHLLKQSAVLVYVVCIKWGGSKKRANADMDQLGYLPFIALIRPLLGTPVMDAMAGQIARDNSAYIKYGKAQMEQRIAAEKDSTKQTRKDFMHYLLDAKDPKTGRSITASELNADSNLMIAAGSDTTSITISATTFYLLHYPAALAKVTAEIRRAFASVDEIRGGSTLNGQIYLRACIDEALRLSPPVPSHLLRAVLAGGLTIDGHHFPRGTVVGTSIYAIHHCEEYFPDPFVFRPERWIVAEKVDGGATAEAVAKAQAAFCPFSLGPRGCIGKKLAYLEVMLALATLLFLYDIRIPESADERNPSGEGRPDDKHWGRRRKDEYQVVDHFLSWREGPMFQLKARVL